MKGKNQVHKKRVVKGWTEEQTDKIRIAADDFYNDELDGEEDLTAAQVIRDLSVELKLGKKDMGRLQAKFMWELNKFRNQSEGYDVEEPKADAEVSSDDYSVQVSLPRHLLKKIVLELVEKASDHELVEVIEIFNN